MKKISIIICTYNRDYILSECLDSLVRQTVNQDAFEVIVVNNNSTDNTQQVAERYYDKIRNYKIVLEPSQGLSFARNRGALESESDWIFYIDDDAKATSNLVERALFIIDNFNFDCFGGTYIAWWKYKKPEWLPESFGTKPIELHETGVLTLDNALGYGYLSGGVFCINKKVLQKVEGFPVDLGMSGSAPGYGEEVYVQDALRNNGFLVGYDPSLIIEHLVADYKLKPLWHLKRSYYLARDGVKYRFSDGNVSWRYIIYTLFKDMFLNFPKLFYNDYYIQNYFIDCLTFTSIALGKKAGFKKFNIDA